MKLTVLLLLASFLSPAQNPEAGKDIGEKIKGHFLDKSKFTTVEVVQLRGAQGNPVEDGISAAYEIRFSDRKLKPIKADCCDITLINEGDLNHDGKDELSVYQAPMNGCSYTMTTYALIKGQWQKIVDSYLVPSGCETLSEKELQDLVFKKNQEIYYLSKDMSQEHGPWIRNKVNPK